MNVFDIEINGEFIDLSDTSIRYELVNALLTAEDYRGDYSFPGSAPMTDKNKQVFGFAHKIETNNRVIEYPCTLYIFGVPKFSPKFTITRATNSSIAFKMTGGIRGLGCADKKLAEILTGEYALGNDQDAVLALAKTATETGDWSVYGFVFPPFYQPNFYEGNNPSFNGVVNRVDCTTGNILGNSATVVNNQYTLVPWFYLFYVLNKIWFTENLTPKGSVWTHPELSKLLLTNNRAIDIRPTDNNTKVLSTVVQNFTSTGQKVQFSSSPAGSYDNLNAWDDPNDQYNIKVTGVHNFTFSFTGRNGNSSFIRPVNIDPGIFVVKYDGVMINSFALDDEALQGYTKTWTIVAAPGDIGKSVLIEFLDSSASFQGSSFVEILIEASLQVTLDAASQPASTATVLKYANHLADWTVAKLLAEVKKLGINFDFDFRNSTVTMEPADVILSAPTSVDITGQSEVNYEMDLEESGAGYTVSYDLPDEEAIVVDPEKLIGEFFVHDVSELPAPAVEGSLAINSATNQVYKVVKVLVNLNEWELQGSNYGSYKTGRGATDIKCSLAPVQMCIAENEGGTADEKKALMPYFVGAGSSELYGSTVKPVEFRLAFWRGYNENQGKYPYLGGKYIYAGTDIYGINQFQVGKLSLRLDRPESMYISFNEKLLRVLTAAEFTEFMLNLRAIDFENIKATTKLNNDFNDFLMKSFSIVLSKNSVKVKGILLRL